MISDHVIVNRGLLSSATIANASITTVNAFYYNGYCLCYNC